MTKKVMLINADHPEECRAVLLENGKMEDFIVEHASHEQIKGNIYLAQVNRIEPAIEAAFMDFGGRKYGFLPFKDVRKESYLRTGEKKARVRIQDVLVRYQDLLVQVVKEGRDAKGPSLTNGISLPGRFLVLMVGQEASAVSRKIEDETERKKLKEILAGLDLPENMGLIIRTAGLGRTKLELQKDLHMLLKIWEKIEKTMESDTIKAPSLLYQEPNMVVRTVRDHFTADTEEIIVDNVEAYEALKDFIRMVMPRMRNRVILYQEIEPLFSKYKVEEQIESIYNRKVLLPSGGSIVIDSGEAMVSIDVNSGKTTSASQLEETALKTNLEAAEEVARQLRLRDLGGLIVIDFIDMFQKKNKSLVEREFKQKCKKDKARINISRISKFGLLEISRQRMSPPVIEGAFVPCSHCGGTGHIKSMGSIVLNVLRKIKESLAEDKIKILAVEVSPEVGDYLLNHKMLFLMELQEKHKFSLEFFSKPGLSYEEFTYKVIEKKKEEEIFLEAKKSAESETAERGERRPKTTKQRTRPVRTVSRQRYPRKKATSRRTGTNRGRRRPSSDGAKGNSRQRERAHNENVKLVEPLNETPENVTGNRSSSETEKSVEVLPVILPSADENMQAGNSAPPSYPEEPNL